MEDQDILGQLKQKKKKTFQSVINNKGKFSEYELEEVMLEA